MSVQLKLSGSGSRAFTAEIVTLPASVKLPTPGMNRIGGLFVGLIFTIIGYYMFKVSTQSGFDLRALLALGMGAFGGMTLARTIFSPKGQTTMIFHDDYVEVVTAGWLRKSRWLESYKNFKGLKTRTKSTPSRPNRNPYQIIELIHKDQAKTLPLYAVRREGAPIDHMEHYADILDVEILN